MNTNNVPATAPVTVEIGQSFLLQAPVRVRPSGGNAQILFPQVEAGKLLLHCLNNDLASRWIMLPENTRCTLISSVEQTDTWCFAVELYTASGYKPPAGMILRRAAFENLCGAARGMKQPFVLRQEAKSQKTTSVKKSIESVRTSEAAAKAVQVFELDPLVEEKASTAPTVADTAEVKIETFDLLGDSEALPPEPEATHISVAAPEVSATEDVAETNASDVDVTGDSLDDLLMD